MAYVCVVECMVGCICFGLVMCCYVVWVLPAVWIFLLVC